MQARDARRLGRKHGSQAAGIAARKCRSCSCSELRDMALDIFVDDLLSLDWTHRGRPVQDVLSDSAQKFREYEKAARKALALRVNRECGR